MSTAYLSLGSNLGDRLRNLRDAIAQLEAAHSHVSNISPVYESTPVGETREPVPAYLNCAVRIETSLRPSDLLAFTQSVERAGGREPSFRWGPRTIDIDILLYDSVTLDSPDLTIPHSRLNERRFALRTLADIAPGLVLPDGTRLEERLSDPVVAAQDIGLWPTESDESRD
jgi:2-amino-4-hydroxy-6-hydroxymethyldihydropteridine diphosphokinase